MAIFLEAELGYKLLSEPSVRKDYLETVVQTKRKTMITELQGKDLYVIFDETAIKNEQVFAALVGDVMSPRNPYLITILEGDRVDSGFVSTAIFKELYKAFGDEVHLELIVRDGAGYYLKAGQILRDLYDSHGIFSTLGVSPTIATWRLRKFVQTTWR